MQIGGNCRNRLSFENRQRLIECPCLSESRPNLRCPKQPAYLGKGREEGGRGRGRPKYRVNEVDGIVVRAVEIDRLSQTCQRRGRRRDHTEQSVGDRDATTDARRAETLTVEKTTDNHLLVKPISPSNPDRIFDKADCFPFVTRSSEMSSSDRMGEIIRVKLRVDPDAIANERSAALVKQDRVLSGLRSGDEAGCPGRELSRVRAKGPY